FEQACRLKCLRIERRPLHSVSAPVFLEYDRAVTSNRHIECLRFDAVWIEQVLPNFDLFVTNFSIAPTRRRHIAIGIFFVELFEIDVLHIRPKIRRAPGDPLVMAKDYPRRARKSYARD